MRLLLMVLLLMSVAPAVAEVKMTIDPGPVNGVLLETNARRLAIYGWKDTDHSPVDLVLLSHGRRDVIWKAESALAGGAQAVAPNRARYSLESAADFWQGFPQNRFHDYAQQSTKILTAPLEISRWVNDGDVVEWQGVTFHVFETPGYTRGSATFITDIAGQKTAFTGDLIYGDGQILDLYSFQDAIPEAQIRGYHGYGARLADLVASLQKIAAEKPDLIVPSRGPVIRDPQASIARLIERVQTLYRNYLSTNALHWYFKEDRMRLCGERVLGTEASIELMPYAHHEQTPSWVFEHSTSRLLISDSGGAFLLDCGYQRVIDAVRDLITQGVIEKVEGIFVTHYHDDHTDMVQAAAEVFGCPVYATKEYADVLTHPGAWHLPAMTANPIRNIKVVNDGHQMQWHEFQLTFHFFPGQTYYHGALMAEKPEQVPIFFVGDAFAPSGLDDYCVLNRNLVHDDSGYLLCLKKLRGIGRPFWLVNEHIPFVFRFSQQELDYLESRYRQRISVMKELFPWDDPNYGIDEQWAVMYPRGQTAAANRNVSIEVRITNHSPAERTFSVSPKWPAGWTAENSSRTLTLPARQAGTLELSATTSAAAGIHVVTADIASDGMVFREWLDAIVTVP